MQDPGRESTDSYKKQLLLKLLVQPRVQKARAMLKEEHLPQYFARNLKNGVQLSELNSKGLSNFARIEAELHSSLEKNYMRDVVRKQTVHTEDSREQLRQESRSVDLSPKKPSPRERDAISFDGFMMNYNEVQRGRRLDSAHFKNCSERRTAPSSQQVYYDESVRLSPEQKRRILRKKFAVGANPTPAKPNHQKSFPRDLPQDSLVAADASDLDNRIFYYRFNRKQRILENKPHIISELRRKVRDRGETLLSLSVSKHKADLSEDFPSKRKTRFVEVKSKVAEYVYRKGEAKLDSSEDRLDRLLQCDREEEKTRPKVAIRNPNSELLAAERWLQENGHRDDLKVVFENPYRDQNTRLEDNQVDLLQSIEFTIKQQEISENLDRIGRMVSEVFMSHNQNKLVGERGVITLKLIRYLSESLRNIDKIRELDSTMQGLYNSLSQVSFFSMFRMSEACQIFSWCQLINLPKGYKSRFFKTSNVIVVLSGRVNLNQPGKLQRDANGRVVVESFKMPRVAHGNYEHISFSLTDGHYVTGSVFKFMSSRPA